MTGQGQYDVVVAGASVAGCTAATLYARQGLQVALLEKDADPNHYKKICTHFLQPAALKTLRKLGLDEKIEAAGGVRNDLEVWTKWGWIRAGRNAPESGYNLRRQTLDPILRGLAAETRGVELFEATAARDLMRDDEGRVAGVVADGPAGRREFRAPLVVAADGRASVLAERAGVAPRQHENDRFTYFTYYRGLPLGGGVNARYWHLDPDLAYAFRNDDDTTLLGIFLPTSELKAFKADPMGHFRRFWDRVPGGPCVGTAEPICELRGITRMINQWRPAAAPGIAFVGDAAMVLDPIWGTGCGFGFLSADWLVEATLPSFASGRWSATALDRGLARYRRLHRARTRGHYHHIASFSKVRGPNLIERLLFSAAARDPDLASRVLRYLGRTVGPLTLAAPSALLRAAWVNLISCQRGNPDNTPIFGAESCQAKRAMAALDRF
jgi:flavin-dependent dehydrogenase